MRHFLDISDLSQSDVDAIFASIHAVQLTGSSCLNNKSVGLIFEKPSNRTRMSFEVGVHQLSGQPVYIKGDDIQMGVREPISHISRVMSRYVDLVMIRSKSHQTLVEFAKHATIPVINGLSDWSHPCQAMADVLTIRHHFPTLNAVHVAYIGDGNNVCQSLMEMSVLCGFKMTVVCPEKYAPTVVPMGVHVSSSMADIRGAHVIYTDVWVSMGDEAEVTERHAIFQPYQVNESVMKIAHDDAIFLHCLPANIGEEVTHNVFESRQSKVFDQAENRLHAQNGIMAWLMKGVL